VDGIQFERRDELAILRLDKPRGNAIDEPLLDGLLEICERLPHERGLRGVLFASAHAKLFCPGLDLVALLAYDLPAMERFMSKFNSVMAGLYSVRQPMVAAIGGHAVAGGCVLALTADYRILRGGGVQIGLNEVKIGVPLPFGVSALLRGSVEPRALARIALLGENLAGKEALASGLVHEVVEGPDFEATCLARLAEFAARDPDAFGTTKAYLRASTLREIRLEDQHFSQEFLRAWFSPPTRERLLQIVASLKKP